MRLGNDYCGIIIEKDFFSIHIFPFSFDIFIFRGIDFHLSILDSHISLRVGFDYLNRWN